METFLRRPQLLIMPDILSILSRRWRLILWLTLAGAAAALVASLLSPKLYLGQATALPANTALGDKARIFNNNIEGLYSEWGSSDDLERIEGTAKLDTPYIALAKTYRLVAHYGLDSAKPGVLQKAAVRLRKSSLVARSGYGEMQVKVWDKDSTLAATLANALLQTLNDMHSGLQVQNNKAILEKLREEYALKKQLASGIEGQVVQYRTPSGMVTDSIAQQPNAADALVEQEINGEERRQYAKLIGEYELALKTAPRALLVVESARPQLAPDRPKTARNVLLALLASLFFSFLFALFIDSRKAAA